MNFLRYYILTFLIFFSFIIKSQISILEKEIEKIINFDSDISYQLTPGFIVGVIDEDSTYFISFGKHKDTKEKIVKTDVFEIGSASKTFTATLVLTLVNKGIIKLDDKVNDFLPLDFQNPRLRNLTIDNLLNHQTYFPKRPYLFGEKEDDAQNPYGRYSKKDLLEYYSRFVPEKNSNFNYSHINYAILEILIENVTQTDYNNLLSTFLSEPLHLSNTFVDLKERKSGVIAKGVDRSMTFVEPWTFNSFAASEGVKSSAEDMINLLKPFMSTSESNFDLFLPQSLKKSYPSFNEKLFYSNGWHGIKISKKINAFVSNGNTSGHSAFIGMVPETKTGVVVLSNSAFGTKDLGLLVLRMINYNWKRKIN